MALIRVVLGQGHIITYKLCSNKQVIPIANKQSSYQALCNDVVEIYVNLIHLSYQRIYKEIRISSILLLFSLTDTYELLGVC